MDARAESRRVVVAQPDEVAPGTRGIAVPVGLARPEDDRRWTVIVKATFAFPVEADGALALAAEQEPLRLDVPGREGGELAYASDFDGPPGSVITLEGLSSLPGRRALTLPDLAPRVTLEELGGGVRLVEMARDRLWVDAHRAIAVLLWRGSIEMDPARAMVVRRIAVSLEEAAAPRDPAALHRDLARGRLAFAVVEDELRAPGAPAGADLLTLARLELWAELLSSGETDPALPLDAYARISAALAEGVGSRGEVLRGFGLDEERWSIEEQGWLLRLSRDATGGGALAAAFGARFVVEQDRLERPEEAEIGVDDYAAVRDAVEQADDPAAALRPWALTLPMWMRLQRRVMRASLGDPELAASIRTKLAALRAERRGAS